MTNPFDDQASVFLVLINNDGQYSLWPERNAVPLGWARTFGPADKQACLDFVNEHWVDMRPLSLVTEMQAARQQEP